VKRASALRESIETKVKLKKMKTKVNANVRKRIKCEKKVKAEEIAK